MSMPNESITSELKATYGETLSVTTVPEDLFNAEIVVISKPLSRVNFQRVSDMVGDKGKLYALTQICKWTTVWITGAASTKGDDVLQAFEDACNKQPAIAVKVGDAVFNLAGATKECETKKF